MTAYADYPSADCHKLLGPNRDLYLMQSAMTVNGRVPTMEEVRRQFDSVFDPSENDKES